MSQLIQKRSVMLLYAKKNDIASHQVRLILAEKGLVYEIEWTTPESLPESLKALNPYQSLPVLVDRDSVLYELRTLMEYLDERFPHPPLMPVYPIARANNRLFMYRMQKDWCEGLKEAFDGEISAKLREAAQDKLVKKLESISQVFETFEYFMSEEFGLLDCFIAPILWELQKANKLPEKRKFEALNLYALNLFRRSSFQETVSVEKT